MRTPSPARLPRCAMIRSLHQNQTDSRIQTARLRLQFARHGLEFEALDHVALLDVVVILERHAAIHALLVLADASLETIVSRQRASVVTIVLAHQPAIQPTMHKRRCAVLFAVVSVYL